MAKMGAPVANDRKLAAEVRSLSLRKIKAILEDDKHERFSNEFQQQVILKLAGTVLPRLNEHTGANGEKLFPAPLLAGKSNANPINNSTD